jgi:hypothetical protein
MNNVLSEIDMRRNHLLLMFLLCPLLSGCALGWVGTVDVVSLEPLQTGEIVAAISGMNGVSISGLPLRHVPEGWLYESIGVTRGNVVAFIRFPTPLGRKSSDAISIDTSLRSADGKAFVRDLADALQKRFGNSAVRPRVEPLVNDGGP